MEDQLKEKETNKWILMSEEQIINSIYNAGLLHEFMLKYSLEEFKKPYNQLPMSETMKLAEKVEKDSVYRSRKKEGCG